MQFLFKIFYFGLVWIFCSLAMVSLGVEYYLPNFIDFKVHFFPSCFNISEIRMRLTTKGLLQ